MPLTLNGITAIKVRLVIPWRGVWYAVVELDAPDATAAQVLAANATPAVLTLGDMALLGTTDPAGSGTFQNRATIRVVGGQGNWGDTVPAKHFYGAGGSLTTTMVYAETAALVGETFADPTPQPLGAHYPRAQGPASSVFGDRDWRVDLTTGVAIVASWGPAVLSPDSVLLDFDATNLEAKLASDAVILPGTVLADLRFNGATYTVREVEQVFDANGSFVHALCSANASSRLVDAFAQLARQAVDAKHLKAYRYRFALNTGNQLALQSIDPDAPNLNPIDQWTGLSGAADSLAVGTEIVVGFDSTHQPYIAAFSPLTTPLTVNINAATAINLGPAGTAKPLALGPALAALITALQAFATGLNAGTLAGQASTLATALGAMTTVSTVLTKAN